MKPSRRQALVFALLFSCLAFCTLVCGAELALRLSAGRIGFTGSFLPRVKLEDWHPIRYDARLGWSAGPPETAATPQRSWKSRIVPYGNFWVRPNRGEEKAVPAGADILAVGDSFTYGDEVGEAETWPAYLSRDLGREVVNGGVCAYGLDQAYLRAMELTKARHYRLMLFSFIADDFERDEFSERFGHGKPFFALEDDGLALRNVPVPRAVDSKRAVSGLRQVLSHSLLLHTLFARYYPFWWFQGIGGVEKREHADGKEVACRLLRKLDQWSRDERTPMVIVPQYSDRLDWELSEIKDVLDCARLRTASVIDTGAYFRELLSQDPQRFHSLFTIHMTAEGNELLAKRIAAGLAGVSR